ncbi:4'-phosphopantetheinyl transferase family protein [Flavobacterium ajazii]|uniref:4'-phosphopantetheinyl transferase family protein n=1 Tax=Flavobacterium ajazii TaxID=2692318 RepID=UPI0013CFE50F|nr:4'-phosphopantetheinyl transferase superfamily protein [Flavobacterium ajazii]
MIGNDVIDLRQSRIESNWQRKGFIEKLFTDTEKQLIKDYHNPEIMVWLLWSMKEAAYKIYNRQTKIREYIPKKLSCSIIKLVPYIQGFVICNGNKYYTKTLITSENIHTVAASTSEDLNNIIEIERKGIIKTENGIPYLYVSNENTFKEVSISNHGRFERVIRIAEN